MRSSGPFQLPLTCRDLGYRTCQETQSRLSIPCEHSKAMKRSMTYIQHNYPTLMIQAQTRLQIKNYAVVCFQIWQVFASKVKLTFTPESTQCQNSVHRRSQQIAIGIANAPTFSDQHVSECCSKGNRCTDTE